MNAIRNVLTSTCRAISFGSEVIGYAATFGRSLVTPKAVLAARLLAAESPLAMCTQRIEGKTASCLRRPRVRANTGAASVSPVAGAPYPCYTLGRRHPDAVSRRYMRLTVLPLDPYEAGGPQAIRVELALAR